MELKLDTSFLDGLQDQITARGRKLIEGEAAGLAHQIHARIIESATNGPNKLHARRERYVGALSFHEVNDHTWLINLDHSAAWIDDGLPETQMLNRLVSGPKSKESKDGHRYVVIPFQHGPGPSFTNSEAGRSANELKKAVERALKSRKIPFGKLEMDIDSGEPKQGKLHEFSLEDPKHPKKGHDGIGQGHGAIGDPRKGYPGDDSAARFLERVSVRQRKITLKNGKSKTIREVLTFRTASDKQGPSQQWVHPGSSPKHFFEDAQAWAEKQWEQVIVPRLLTRLV